MQESCGEPVFKQGPRFQNPYTPHDVVHLMTTSFAKVEEIYYVTCRSFRFFLWLIVMMWYINLLGEVQDLISLWDFLTTFPVVAMWPFFTEDMRKSFGNFSSRLSIKFQQTEGPKEGGGGEEEAQEAAFPTPSRRLTRSVSERTPLLQRVLRAGRNVGSVVHSASASYGGLYQGIGGNAGLIETVSGAEAVRIEFFDRVHYFVCVSMAALRTVILYVLCHAGTYFLLSNHTLLDLLLNALALAFILELDEFVFDFVVSSDAKELILEKLEPLQYTSSIPSKGLSGLCCGLWSSKAFWGLVMIPLIAWAVVEGHYKVTVFPMMEALDCLCLKRGDRCLAATVLTKSWFDEYWSRMAVLAGRT